MAKYTKQRVETICELYKEGVQVKEICKAVGISKDTFYRWQEEKPDFSDSLKKAEDEMLTEARQLIKKGIIYLLTPREEVETVKIGRQGENGQIVPSMIKQTKRNIAPDKTILIFAAKQLMGEIFNQQPTKHEHEGNGLHVVWNETRTYESEDEAHEEADESA